MKYQERPPLHEGTGVLDGVQGSLATRAATRPDPVRNMSTTLRHSQAAFSEPLLWRGDSGDVLRSLSKKKMYGSPNSNPSPELGADKENHTHGKVLPSQRLLKQFEERLVFGDMNLSEIVRSGAQMMLQYALEREVTEALGRGYYENAPETTKEKGRRNGYESHRVLTGEGAVTVQVPQIRETSTGFRSKILDAYVSRTEKLDELIARMYVHGMSTRDIEATFADVLSGTGVSKSVVSRVTQCLSDDFEVFRKRDLSSEELFVSRARRDVLALPPGSREERAHPRCHRLSY